MLFRTSSPSSPHLSPSASTASPFLRPTALLPPTHSLPAATPAASESAPALPPRSTPPPTSTLPSASSRQTTSPTPAPFAQATGDIKATAPTVLGIGSTVFSWTSADLLELSAALDAYVAGTISTVINVFVKAGIDTASFTKAHAVLLQAFLTTCVASDVNITVAAKVDLVKFVGNAISVAGVACTDLTSRVQTHISVLIKVVTALKLDVKTATCASASDALKLAIHAYVKSCIEASKGLLAAVVIVSLNTLLAIVNIWIATGCGAAAGLLNLNLKAATDVTVCKSIVAYLLGLSGKFDLFAYIKLDAATCYQVLSAVVVAN